MRRTLKTFAVIALLSAVWGMPAMQARAADVAAVNSGMAVSEKGEAALLKGLAYLKTQQQPDGGWQKGKEPPGVTAIVLRALAARAETGDPVMKKGYDKLVSYQLENGGIYKDLLANYNTAIAISALAAAKDPAYKVNLEKAVNYLKSLQWKDNIAGLPRNEQVDPKNPSVGGFGYSKQGRADGSNTQFALDALHDAGVSKDDPAYQNALKFVSRLQNLSETNDQPWTGNDGGFVYSPANNGESQAGEYTDAAGKRLVRSYGSMTYAGLKSMIYAGLSKDDPRVKAAWAWIVKNYSVDENPGMKDNKPDAALNGIYYYYQTMARALRAYGEPTVTDAQGNGHDWRVELVNKLAGLQKPDGSWVGEARWMEGNPVLVSSYIALALEETLADLKEHPAK